MSVTLRRCTSCGHICFPARLVCHRCGGADWAPVAANRGVVEEMTNVRYQADAAPGTGATYLASVRTVGGTILVARLSRAVAPGAEVDLTLSATGGIVGG